MLFTTLELARAANQNSAHVFVNNVSRYAIKLDQPIRVGSEKHWPDTALAQAVILGRLDALGVPKSKQPDLLSRVDHVALRHALEQLDAGEIGAVIVGIASFDELEDFSGVFTSSADAVAALDEADMILLDVGGYLQARWRGYM
jgi:hypothetical protein